MVTVVLSVLSSLQTYHPSQWELESESSCTLATYEEARFQQVSEGIAIIISQEL
ncbi:unnamed protein product [Arabidopsis thaliana]|uniref:(thale cress) hypothetical protein n=1 Tax=Arabidopsis thaliana TaxID=3702 RepID=A0A7G2ERK5_ARATH|nr:unnamed protein product [Arabidopsis thaliana]